MSTAGLPLHKAPYNMLTKFRGASVEQLASLLNLLYVAEELVFTIPNKTIVQKYSQVRERMLVALEAAEASAPDCPPAAAPPGPGSAVMALMKEENAMLRQKLSELSTSQQSMEVLQSMHSDVQNHLCECQHLQPRTQPAGDFTASLANSVSSTGKHSVASVLRTRSALQRLGSDLVTLVESQKATSGEEAGRARARIEDNVKRISELEGLTVELMQQLESMKELRLSSSDTITKNEGGGGGGGGHNPVQAQHSLSYSDTRRPTERSVAKSTALRGRSRSRSSNPPPGRSSSGPPVSTGGPPTMIVTPEDRTPSFAMATQSWATRIWQASPHGHSAGTSSHRGPSPNHMPVWQDEQSRKTPVPVRFVDCRARPQKTISNQPTDWNQQRMNELFETCDLLVRENAELRSIRGIN